MNNNMSGLDASSLSPPEHNPSSRGGDGAESVAVVPAGDTPTVRLGEQQGDRRAGGGDGANAASPAEEHVAPAARPRTEPPDRLAPPEHVADGGAPGNAKPPMTEPVPAEERRDEPGREQSGMLCYWLCMTAFAFSISVHCDFIAVAMRSFMLTL